MLRKGIPAVSLSTLFVSNAMAGNWIYQAQGSQSVVLTGGTGAVANAQGTFYNGSGSFSYNVILDSGSSGFLMSNFVQTSFNVPLLSSTTYEEVGIGGTETMNVTQPIQAYFAPLFNNGNPVDPDLAANYSNFGTFKFEARQNDPLPDGLLFFDIMGTPVLAHTVMQVIPNHIADLINTQLYITNIAETHLLNSVPALPAKGVYHVPLSFQNFVAGTPAPTEDTNPVVKNVKAKATGQSAVTADWLLDTGAQFSIVSPAFAATLGIDTSLPPVVTVQGSGVGGTTVVFDGYRLAELDLPLSTPGDFLVVDNPVVFIPQVDNLPADLTGVLGENLFMQSTDLINPNTAEATNPKAPLFQSWYLDGPGSQLILVDPNSLYAVPEPASLGLLVIGGIPLLMRRSRQKNS